MANTAKTTSTPARVRVDKHIYRRGDIYEIRIPYKTGNGNWTERWETVGSSIREARARRDALKGDARKGLVVQAPADLTVTKFLRDHFVPHLHDRVERLHSLEETTLVKYEEYVEHKVIPALGHKKLSQLTTGDIEDFYRDLHVGGRHSATGMGRPKRYSEHVYRRIAEGREQGWSYTRIAETLAAELPGECSGMTKNSVAAIDRRARQPKSTTAKKGPGPLSIATVEKVDAMMRTAWNYAVRHKLVPADHRHTVEDAVLPRRPKTQPRHQVVHWTPDQYRQFFAWAKQSRQPELWVTLAFLATSADRVSGNLGLRWHEVDLDGATANLNVFVKYLGRKGRRVLIQPYGKTTGGHTIALDSYTVAMLKEHKARQSAALLARTDRHTCPDPFERDCPLPGYHDRGLVFPQSDGNYRNPNKLLALLHQAIDAYNRDNPDDPLPRVHLHSMRHAWQTFAESAGVPRAVAMDRLDQTTLRVNDGYTHTLPADAWDAAERVAGRIFGPDSSLIQPATGSA